MRVKLRDDLMYVPVDDGVYLETGLASTHLAGASAYGLVQRLAPHLDGTRTVQALTAGLPPAQRQLVTDLVRMLVRRGIARDLDSEPPHTLRDWELDTYRDSIAFAEHVSDAPLSRFEAFRDGRVLLVGAGAGMLALVQTLFELGLRTASLVETTETGTERDGFRRIVQRRRAEDPTTGLTLLDAAAALGTDEGLAGLLTGYDAVLHCAARPMAGRATRLNRAARAIGVPVLHAVPGGAEAWIGPTGGGVTGGCWECSLLSRQGAGLPPGDADEPDTTSEWLSAPVCGLIGAALGFAYLRHRMGAETTATNRMTRVDLETAVTSEHLLDVHPRCRSCRPPAPYADLAAHVDAMAARTPVGVEEFVARMPFLVDARLGPLLAIDTGAHSQISVSCVEATVVDLAGGAPRLLTAVGASREQALLRAATAALETLAARACAGDTATVWWDTARGAVVDVQPDGVVIAGGHTWAEARGRAILKLRRAAATPPEVADGGPPGGWLDRARWPEPTRVMAHELALLGHEPRAWHDGSSTPTVFVAVGGGWVARSCATDTDTALANAMQAAVAVLTGRRPDGAEIGPDVGGHDWDTALPPLLRELARDGRSLLVRPADSLPGAQRVMPFMIRAAWSPRAGSSE
ncbi:MULTISPECIES: hypothetical protein [unclassified Micromonospora]|uniref:hypothetical protein n=1 Tax=unclassified Micromonospora TaxID=2617518 RepID=UPI0015E7F5C7|nr:MULTISPECIES: hypothetical protein [unclassified Micromonospora]MCK1806653.1 hypothetical protein [Micromonospora sp. R42106]MCK1833709.1 hypothetical protein [Micromonospora sp. R42003]MCK1842783.1 hypothetical protein [Micromonospora sp. R42004]MCM1019183.1 hypothetical protein [Micromonospora sp. XM-20-01]